MKSQSLRSILSASLILYLGAVFIYQMTLKEKETPPLTLIYDEIKNEFYIEYLCTTNIPTTLDFLSPRSKRLMQIYSNSFTWNPETRALSYMYDKTYPLNRCGIPKLLTFGLVDLEPQIGGEDLTPNTITNNALLYKARGKL